MSPHDYRGATEMTNNPCNCSTCSIAHVADATTHVYFCRVQKRWIFELQFDYIKISGCLDHPQAREYLMKDVITELKHQSCDQSGWLSLDEYNGAEIAFKRSIALIRDGVKKK